MLTVAFLPMSDIALTAAIVLKAAIGLTVNIFLTGRWTSLILGSDFSRSTATLVSLSIDGDQDDSRGSGSFRPATEIKN